MMTIIIITEILIPFFYTNNHFFAHLTESLVAMAKIFMHYGCKPDS